MCVCAQHWAWLWYMLFKSLPLCPLLPPPTFHPTDLLPSSSPRKHTLWLQDGSQQAVSEEGWWDKHGAVSLSLSLEQLTPQHTDRCGSIVLWSYHRPLTVSQDKKVGGCSNYPLEDVSRSEVTGFLSSTLRRLSAFVCIYFFMDTLGVSSYVAWHLGIHWGDFPSCLIPV